MGSLRLGKGLEALFKQKDIDTSSIFEDKYQNIPIEFIEPNPFQPRKNFEEHKLLQLAESIKRHGLLQPIVVRVSPSDHKKFQIVAGERRWRACKILKMESIPAIVLELSDEDLLLVALIENLQREDLNPIEEAEALYNAQKILNITHEELAKRIGKSRSAVTNMIRLLKLDEEIKDAVREGKITPGQARPLLAVEDKDARLFLFDIILKKNLSSRKIEELVAFWKKNKTFPKEFLPSQTKNRHVSRTPSKDFLKFKKEVQKSLTEFFKVPAKIIGDFKKGKIVLQYSSPEELKVLIEKLKEKAS